MQFSLSVGLRKVPKDFSGYVGACKSLAREILGEPTQNILNEEHIETECNSMPACKVLKYNTDISQANFEIENINLFNIFLFRKMFNTVLRFQFCAYF